MARDKNGIPNQKLNVQIVARWVSSATHPVLLAIPLVLLVSFRAANSWREGLQWSSLYLLLAILGPAALLMQLARSGWLINPAHARRAERIKPLAISLACLVITVALLQVFEAPSLLRRLALIQLAQAALMTAITPAWQISFHGATSGALAATALLFYGAGAWPLAGLLPLVGWAQVVRGRHTAEQVAAGICLGVVLYTVGLTL